MNNEKLQCYRALTQFPETANWLPSDYQVTVKWLQVFMKVRRPMKEERMKICCALELWPSFLRLQSDAKWLRVFWQSSWRKEAQIGLTHGLSRVLSTKAMIKLTCWRNGTSPSLAPNDIHVAIQQNSGLLDSSKEMFKSPKPTNWDMRTFKMHWTTWSMTALLLVCLQRTI